MEEVRGLVDDGSVTVRGAGMYEPSTFQPCTLQAAGLFLRTAYKVSTVLLKTASRLKSKGSVESVSAKDEGIF